MAKITRYTGNLKAFAENSTGTKRTVFGDVAQSNTLDANVNADFLKGWEIIDETTDFPTIQDFNAMGFTHGQLLAYLHQVGVPEWSGTQEYHIGSIVNRAGVLYVCKTNTHVSATAPETDTVNWEVPYYNKANILGTVSQSAGVPTGALMEYGSNANGGYWKYAGGMMVCTLSRTDAAVAIATAFMGGFRSTIGAFWTYPSAFTVAPVIHTCPNELSSFNIVAASSTISTSVVYCFTSVTSQASADRQLLLTAIGRWY